MRSTMLRNLLLSLGIWYDFQRDGCSLTLRENELYVPTS